LEPSTRVLLGGTRVEIVISGERDKYQIRIGKEKRPTCEYNYFAACIREGPEACEYLRLTTPDARRLALIADFISEVWSSCSGSRVIELDSDLLTALPRIA